MDSIKKNYKIPTSAYTIPTTVISLTPLISSSPSSYVGSLRPFYQQNKFPLTSHASPLLSPRISSIGIHNTDDDFRKKSPSSNDIFEKNSSKDEDSSLSSDKV